LVGGWVVGFAVIVGIVMVDGAENSWVEEKGRDKGERDRERERIKKNKKRIFK